MSMLRAQQQPQSKPVFTRHAPSATPVEIFDHIVYVPVKINHQGPYAFILDTGNNNPPLLDEAMARRTGIPLGKPSGAEDAGAGTGGGHVQFFEIDQVSCAVPGVEFTSGSAVALSMAHMDRHWGKHHDGLLGDSILDQVITRVDYERRTIGFADPDTFTGKGCGQAIPLVREDGFIFAKVKVIPFGASQPIEARMLVDTGARITTFTAPFTQKNHLVQQSPKHIEAMTGFGLSGKTMGEVGRVRALQIGPFRLEHPVIAFSKDTAGALASSSFDGVLGADILHRFLVTFDYSKSTMYLKKNASFRKPFEFDMSGLRWVAEGPDFNHFSIFQVVEQSPAQRAGLQVGDEILEIDGRPASAFDGQSLRRYLQRDGCLLALRIRRNQEELVVQFRLRRLL